MVRRAAEEPPLVEEPGVDDARRLVGESLAAEGLEDASTIGVGDAPRMGPSRRPLRRRGCGGLASGIPGCAGGSDGLAGGLDGDAVGPFVDDAQRDLPALGTLASPRWSSPACSIRSANLF